MNERLAQIGNDIKAAYIAAHPGHEQDYDDFITAVQTNLLSEMHAIDLY